MPSETDTAPPPENAVLLDVSRLIWRGWTRRLPTGIDRVCLAYVDHFAQRAQAVIQREGLHLVLTVRDSRRLFAVLRENGPHFRRQLIAVLARAAFGALWTRPRPGAVYLNIGHTGLDSPALPTWIARHRLRAIYLIHDLIPIYAPEYCRAGEPEKHQRRMTNALASASGIIANSRFTLEELQRFAAAQGMTCVPGVVAWLAGDALPMVARSAPTDHAYFVTIGTIEGRKNHLLLLQLWQRLVARLGEAVPHLMIIGQRGWKADDAFAVLDGDRTLDGAVHELGRCDDVELSRLVRGARAVLMPSFVEGFGMPVIEALQVGTPVIASDLPVFREIAGGIPTYVAASDATGWEHAVLDFAGHSPERARQIAAMRGYRAPDWASHFALVDAFLQQVTASAP